VNAVAEPIADATRVVPLIEAVELNPRPDRAALSDDLDVSFVPMAAVEAGSGRMDETAIRRFGEVKKGYTTFREGDVLFAKITPCMENGKIAVALGLRNGVGCGSTEFHVLRPRPGVDAHYVYHFVSSSRFRAEAAHQMTGAVGQKRVPAAFLEQCEIPLPDLGEQRRIVAEIEKQFSRLDEAVANLKRVKASLKRYKATVLKAAVEGRLVPTEAELTSREGRSFETGAELLRRILDSHRRQWTGKGRYADPNLPDAQDLPALPDGWTWATPQQVSSGGANALAIGPFGSNLKVSDYTSAGVPLVFVRNIRAAVFDDASSVFVAFEKAAELRSHWVRGGDLLVTKMGDPPGDACLYPTHRPPAVITADCIKLSTANELRDGRYLLYAIRSDLVQRQIAGITKGVAQLKISLGRFSSIGIPLPPLSEQRRIVAEIDRRFSIVGDVEAVLERNVLRAVALKAATLDHHFGSDWSTTNG
jgi:type I restriction enzyme S subunit